MVSFEQCLPDEPIADINSNAIQSTAAAISAGTGSEQDAWTVRSLGEWTGIGGFGPVIVGSGATVARELARIQDEADVDGFNLAYAITPGSFEDIVEFVIPELQKLGRYKTEYTPGTLRHKLFGRGDRLPDTHRSTRCRFDQLARTATIAETATNNAAHTSEGKA